MIMNDAEARDTMMVSRYPSSKVIGTYGVLGGAIGGLIVFIPIMIISAMTTPNLDVINIGKMLLSVMIISAAVGFLPSIVVGIMVCKLKLYFDSAQTILPLFAIGLGSTFVLCSAGLIATAILPVKDVGSGVWLLIGISTLCLPIGILGGISSVITGWFALPKHP